MYKLIQETRLQGLKAAHSDAQPKKRSIVYANLKSRVLLVKVLNFQKWVSEDKEKKKQ